MHLREELNLFLTAFIVYLFLLGLAVASVSGGGISPASTCVPLCPSWSSGAAGCGSELGCAIELEGGSDDWQVEAIKWLSPVKAPRRWELALTMTNKDELDEEEGWESAGTERASRNPAGKQDRFAWGWFPDEFARLDMRNCKVQGRKSNEIGSGKVWNGTGMQHTIFWILLSPHFWDMSIPLSNPNHKLQGTPTSYCSEIKEMSS